MPESEVTPQVEYRSIPGFPEYMVGDDGSLKSRRSGSWKQLNPSPNRLGYVCTQIVDDTGKSRQVKLHQLVMLAFVGPCPEGREVRHANSNPSDNHLQNLSYATHSDNQCDQARTGKRVIQLDKEIYRQVRARFDAGESVTSISKALWINEISIKSALLKSTHYQKQIGRINRKTLQQV